MMASWQHIRAYQGEAPVTSLEVVSGRSLARVQGQVVVGGENPIYLNPKHDI